MKRSDNICNNFILWYIIISETNYIYLHLIIFFGMSYEREEMRQKY